jgi:hypothetical protein
MGDFLLGPATPVPLRARRLHWLLPRWGGGMLRVAGDTRTVATLPSAGASDRSSRHRVVRKTSIQCSPHLFFGGKCAPTPRRMDSLPPPGHAGDGSSVCGSPGSPNRVAAWHARFPASAWKGEERREGKILLRHGKIKRKRMEFLRITGLHVEAEPSEVVTTQPKQPLTSVGGHLDARGVWAPPKSVLAAFLSCSPRWAFNGPGRIGPASHCRHNRSIQCPDLVCLGNRAGLELGHTRQIGRPGSPRSAMFRDNVRRSP